MLPVAEITPAVLIFPPCTLAVAESVVALTAKASTLAALLINPAVSKLPPVILAVVVMFEVLFNTLITLPAKLSAVGLTMLAMTTLANTLPVALTNPVVTKFCAMALLVAETRPDVNKLAPVILPVAVT